MHNTYDVNGLYCGRGTCTAFSSRPRVIRLFPVVTDTRAERFLLNYRHVGTRRRGRAVGSPLRHGKIRRGPRRNNLSNGENRRGEKSVKFITYGTTTRMAGRISHTYMHKVGEFGRNRLFPLLFSLFLTWRRQSGGGQWTTNSQRSISNMYAGGYAI